MFEKNINFISIILLLFGSILMLVTGFGLISLEYQNLGLLCYIVFVCIEIKLRISIKKSEQGWKSHKITKHKQKKSYRAWNAQRILIVTIQDSRISANHKSFEMANWSSVQTKVRNRANLVFILALVIFVDAIFGDILLRILASELSYHPPYDSFRGIYREEIL